MRCSAIRKSVSKEKLTHEELTALCSDVLNATAAAGFITDAQVLNTTAIKIGLHMSSFRINTQMLGHNARVCRFVKSPKGYKRTNVPTWDQRVQFNDIVNEIFDRHGLTSYIKSGCYTVRNKWTGACDENDWKYQQPTHYGFNSQPEIYTESEAREFLESDKKEAEHKAATAGARREKARERRARLKLFAQAKRVTVAGFYSWNDKPTKNGKKLTHNQFTRMVEKLSSWEKRRVRSASIEATATQEGLGF